MGIAGAVEHTETNEMQKIFDVNVFGTVNCINAVIPAMRQNGGGKIVCISSVASVASIPFQTFYSMSKSAVNSLVLVLPTLPVTAM
jgi:short-subunit dehydrogenase